MIIVMPYYENSQMLALQYEEWSKYEEGYTTVVIVDDGSERTQAAEVPAPKDGPRLGIIILRHTVNKPWHQHAARNTAMDFLRTNGATDEWVLLTDMDHMLTAPNHASLRREKCAPDTAYMLHRVEPDGSPTLHDTTRRPKPHPNSFYVRPRRFWLAGGYDENLCGIYGTDSDFRNRLSERTPMGFLHTPLVRYSRLVVPDASTTDLPRKEGRKPGDKERAIKYDNHGRRQILTCSMEWRRVR